MISDNFINDLYNASKDGKYDMTFCGYQIIADIKTDIKTKTNASKAIEISNKIDVIRQHGFPWGNLYRKDIILKNQIRFEDTVNYMEDVLFNIDYLMHVDSIALILSAIYYYVKTPNSLSRLGNPVLTVEKTF